VYYITPYGKKLRTRHEIQSHLHDDLTINNFTLVKEAIGADPADEIIRPAKFYNYARRSAIDPVIGEATHPPLGKRIPKPKMPKGASPPPNSQNSSFSSPFTPSNSNSNNNNNSNSKNFSKENILETNKINSSRKQTVKGKAK
jgi:hypothetical protein